MKFFGEFLVEKGVIAKEQLVKALIQQTKALPSVAETVFERKLLEVDQILAIFKKQTTDKSGFIEAAKNLKFWSEKSQALLEEHLASTRVPLGQVLVQMGLVKIEEITHGLDEFLSDVGSNQKTSNVVDKTIEPSSFASLCRLFTTDLQGLLSATFQIDLASSARNGSLSAAKIEILRLKDAAQLATAPKVEAILVLFKELLEELCQKDLSKMDVALSSKIEKTGQISVKLLWEIQSRLATAMTEAEVFRDEAIEIAVRDLAAALEMAKFDLGFLETLSGD